MGNTYFFRNLSRQVGGQHIAFEKLSEKYKSNVIGLKLGGEYVVAVLSYPLVKQVHSREEFEGRPNNFFIRLRTMGTRLGITCTDGAHWNEHRNFTTRHLRQAGYGRLPMEIHIQNELNELLDVIKELKEIPTYPGNFLPPSVINVLWCLTAGKRIPRNDKRLERLLILLDQRSKAFDICGGILTQMPWIRYIAPEKSGYNLIKRFNMELHEFFMETIQEHKDNYSEDKTNDDLIYAYIKEMIEQKGSKSTFTDRQLTMTILDIFIAGSQTTSTTLNLALMMMLIRPDIQEKIKKEIDENICNGLLPSTCEKERLPYTDAFLKEVQRYFHIVPISGPRRVLWTTSLGGYTIPKNTTVLIGLRSVLMDKNHWGDPENFRPERFLDEKMKIINNEYLIPFGQGKRRCLGDSLARACLFTFFVGIMQKFHLELPPNGSKPSSVLLPGITLSPKPYEIVFRAR